MKNQMTVRELIDLLNEYNDDCVVTITCWREYADLVVNDRNGELADGETLMADEYPFED